MIGGYADLARALELQRDARAAGLDMRLGDVLGVTGPMELRADAAANVATERRNETSLTFPEASDEIHEFGEPVSWDDVEDPERAYRL